MFRAISQDNLKSSVEQNNTEIKLSIGFDAFYMTREEALELYSQLEKAIHKTA